MTKTLRNSLLSLAAAAILLPAGLRAADATYTGTIGDEMCGAKHSMGEKDPAKCTRMCVEGDGRYALILSGDSFYALDASPAMRVALDKLAGKKAVIKGELKGKVLTVHAVAPANTK